MSAKGKGSSAKESIPTYSADKLVKMCRDNVGKVVGDGTERGLATFLLNKAGAEEAINGQWSSQIIPTIESAQAGDVIQIESATVSWVEDHDIRKGDHSALRKLYPRPQMIALGNPGSTLIVLDNKNKGANVEIFSQNFSGLAPSCATFVDFKAATNQIGAMWIYRPVQRAEKKRILDGKGPQITPLQMGDEIDPKVRARRANRLRALIKFLDESMQEITGYVDAEGGKRLASHMVAEYDRDYNGTITLKEWQAIASDLNDMFGSTLFNGDLNELRASLAANVDDVDAVPGSGSADGSGDMSGSASSDDSNEGRKKLGQAGNAGSASGSFSLSNGGSASGSGDDAALNMTQLEARIRKYLYQMAKYHEFSKQACILKLALCDDKWMETIVKAAFEDSGIRMEPERPKKTKKGKEAKAAKPAEKSGGWCTPKSQARALSKSEASGASSAESGSAAAEFKVEPLPAGKVVKTLGHVISLIKSETGWESNDVYNLAKKRAMEADKTEVDSREFLMIAREAVRIIIRKLLAQGVRPGAKKTGAARTIRVKVRDASGKVTGEVDVKVDSDATVEISESG